MDSLDAKLEIADHFRSVWVLGRRIVAVKNLTAHRYTPPSIMHRERCTLIEIAAGTVEARTDLSCSLCEGEENGLYNQAYNLYISLHAHCAVHLARIRTANRSHIPPGCLGEFGRGVVYGVTE